MSSLQVTLNISSLTQTYIKLSPGYYNVKVPTSTRDSISSQSKSTLSFPNFLKSVSPVFHLNVSASQTENGGVLFPCFFSLTSFMVIDCNRHANFQSLQKSYKDEADIISPILKKWKPRLRQNTWFKISKLVKVKARIWIHMFIY